MASTLAAAGGIRRDLPSAGGQRAPVPVTCCCCMIAGRSSPTPVCSVAHGFIFSALLGALVIGSISNGMDLLALESSVKYMITGAVLLAAVTLGQERRRGAGPQAGTGPPGRS